MPGPASILLLTVGALMGLGAVVVARMNWRSLITGRVIANWQEVRRARHPLGYWLLICLHLVVCGLFVRSAMDFLFR